MLDYLEIALFIINCDWFSFILMSGQILTSNESKKKPFYIKFSCMYDTTMLWQKWMKNERYIF